MNYTRAIIHSPQPRAGRIKFYIPYKAMEWREKVKAIRTSRYHKPQKLWSIRNTKEDLNYLKEILGDQYDIRYPDEKGEQFQVTVLSENNKDKLAELEKKIILKGYSEHTHQSYRVAFAKFLTAYNDKDVDLLDKKEIENYLYQQIMKYKISNSRQNVIVSAIKFYYETVLGKPREYYDIQRPKKHKTLPNVLSPADVNRLINTPKNDKHRAILYTLYSGGLRVSEIINLRVQDIHTDKGYIFIHGAKGKKDRVTLLAESLLPVLRSYYKKHRPAYWMFEGADGGQYGTSSIQKIFRSAVQKSGVNAWATPHTLRHSFATHLVENGTNLRYIQSLLGHNNSKTTEIYTHVADLSNKVIKSPLDSINLG